jgi:hypothetical protein
MLFGNHMQLLSQCGIPLLQTTTVPEARTGNLQQRTRTTERKTSRLSEADVPLAPACGFHFFALISFAQILLANPQWEALGDEARFACQRMLRGGRVLQIELIG